MNKVYKHIRRFFTMALSVIMLFLLGGFSLYTHQCTTQQIKNVSIIIPAEDCGHTDHSQALACCQDEVEKTCCETEKATSNKDKDCCSDEQEYVKLFVDTIINQTIPQLKVSCIDILAIVISEFRPCECLLNCNLITQIIEESPPQLSTPEYLSKIQVYRI